MDTQNIKGLSSVVVHPIVLLSVVDHFVRVAKDIPNRRVIGVLLGTISKGVVDVTNSYAIPFEEDSRNPNIWFVDHNYHEEMHRMFKKVNAREKVVGWYSTGPKIRPADIEIHKLFKKYATNPIFVIIEVSPKELGIPTKAYTTIEEVKEDGTTDVQFQHMLSEIGAVEAEEVGVEHLLRDIHDSSVSTLTTDIHQKLLSLKSLSGKLDEIKEYLDKVVEGKYTVNHQIINLLQNVFNLLPNLNLQHLIHSFAVKTNDSMAVIYLSSLIRSIITFHNLINNRITHREQEKLLEEEERKKENALEDDQIEQFNIDELEGDMDDI